MKVFNTILLALLVILPGMLRAQSATTNALHREQKDALAFFFYNNTLRMLNQKEDPGFDELIRDIEKMKFLMIDKQKAGFGAAAFRKLVADYKSESFQEIVTSRHDGKNFDVYLKEERGRTKAMLVLVSDSTHLYVLDILGSISPDKITKLYNTLDESADIGKRIRAFTGEEHEEASDGR